MRPIYPRSVGDAHRRRGRTRELALAIALGVLVLGVGGVGAAGAQTAVDEPENSTSIRLTDASGAPGDTLTTSLVIEGASVSGYQATVSYDPNVVELTSVAGTDFDDPVASVDNDEGRGILTQSQTVDERDPTVATLTFTARDTGTTRLELVGETLANDANGTILPTTLEAGSIEVRSSGDGERTPASGGRTVEDGATLDVDDESGIEPDAGEESRSGSRRDDGDRDDGSVERERAHSDGEGGDEMSVFRPSLLLWVGVVLVCARIFARR